MSTPPLNPNGLTKPNAVMPLRMIDASELPAFCPLTASTPDDERLAHLFRGSLKLGRIHPLYLPVQKYRNARADRG